MSELRWFLALCRSSRIAAINETSDDFPVIGNITDLIQPYSPGRRERDPADKGNIIFI